MGWKWVASQDAGHLAEQKKVTSTISLSAGSAQYGQIGSASTISTLVGVPMRCFVMYVCSGAVLMTFFQVSTLRGWDVVKVKDTRRKTSADVCPR
jgi:hypothetical protein